MTFTTILAGFIGDFVEVYSTGSTVDGTLVSVETGLIQVQEQAIYGGLLVSIPTTGIDYVRILV